MLISVLVKVLSLVKSNINGISEKWASLINSVKVNQSPKISKDTPVEDLKLMWVELNSAAEREAA